MIFMNEITKLMRNAYTNLDNGNIDCAEQILKAIKEPVSYYKKA